MHLSVTTQLHNQYRNLYLSLTFCCDFGHVWLSQSLPVESSISAFMCLLLSLLDVLALSLWLHYSLMSATRCRVSELFKVLLKPLDTVETVLRPGVSFSYL